ncbi:MAG: hypothetical protein HKP61_01090 [Dactylosporangium sp.]|nr:hypothetical protein [Dactylosporangium sp.]NNJ59565.1 hypothetical protein [Dactylosporangium sp.]
MTPADVTRLLDLIAAPLALEILDALGHDRTVDAAIPEGTAPAFVTEAIGRLDGIGALAELDPEQRLYELTPRGRRLLAALEQVSAAIEAEEGVDNGAQ